jgi:hypothetical protein
MVVMVINSANDRIVLLPNYQGREAQPKAQQAHQQSNLRQIGNSHY